MHVSNLLTDGISKLFLNFKRNDFNENPPIIMTNLQATVKKTSI
jgi:hypothetical protein